MVITRVAFCQSEGIGDVGVVVEGERAREEVEVLLGHTVVVVLVVAGGEGNVGHELMRNQVFHHASGEVEQDGETVVAGFLRVVERVAGVLDGSGYVGDDVESLVF